MRHIIFSGFAGSGGNTIYLGTWASLIYANLEGFIPQTILYILESIIGDGIIFGYFD